MININHVKNLVQENNSKIVFLVIDGLGGLPDKTLGLTELESARTPYLDSLAEKGICGLQQPVGSGITPGSGPGHLALFGYDPLKYRIGRGVLSALGAGFELQKNDLAARGNFCTVAEDDIVLDRRAGRISTDKNEELCEKLRKIKFDNLKVFIEPVAEHRFFLVFRGDRLSNNIADTDPQSTGVKPIEPVPRTGDAKRTAYYIKAFLVRARELLKTQSPANMILLRGFSKLPEWPTMKQLYDLKCACIAQYPMYKGLAGLLGMNVVDGDGSIRGEFENLKPSWNDHDFFYLHIKATDTAGEDGKFKRKVRTIEEVDAKIPKILNLSPDVILVTGDHSTPAVMKAHSWHPVPVLLWSKLCRPDNVDTFSERSCIGGSLGPRMPATDIMPMILANAQRLKKLGA
jgi:2,3-bisphosphoglycerate-independent phosphoglycerate mutase